MSQLFSWNYRWGINTHFELWLSPIPYWHFLFSHGGQKLIILLVQLLNRWHNFLAPQEATNELEKQHNDLFSSKMSQLRLKFAQQSNTERPIKCKKCSLCHLDHQKAFVTVEYPFLLLFLLRKQVGLYWNHLRICLLYTSRCV